MSTLVAIIIVIVAVIVVVAIAVALMRRRQTENVREQFGPEYDRTVQETGDEGQARDLLVERRKRVEKLNIQPLSDEARTQYGDSWQSVQAEFVDDPSKAIADADALVRNVMRDRGYPVGMFEQRAELISVDHPNVVQDYRIAHDIADRAANGDASTEDLREAMIHYRSLFQDLLGEPQTQEAKA